ncbi:MAG: TIGR03986 family CRISPR-associated RAMP protein [Bacteroidota bacterium]
MSKAPYNFVPFNEKIVRPYWAEYISHDRPFTDGKSGSLTIQITTHSPIFIRDGRKKTQVEQETIYYFSQTQEGKYFIPGSSIRGMLRNVMEIMCFSRMEKVDERKFSVREFENNDLYPKSQITKDVYCGWLYKENGGYWIKDCDKPGRIKLDELSPVLKDKFLNSSPNKVDLRGRNGDFHKSARFKYETYAEINPKGLNFYFKETAYEELNAGNRRFYTIDPMDEGRRGTIVFTGQPSYRNEPRGERASGKVFEFIFFDQEASQNIEVDEKVIKNFFLAYFEDQGSSQQSVDWKYWKPKLEQGEHIPVFFRKEKDSIKDMGLSYLYKISYDYSAKDLISNYHRKENQKGMDLTEAILGKVETSSSETILKSRVHIGHTFALNVAQELPKVQAILSSPKATYYPHYIEQNNRRGYKTYMDANAKIAGWKRYPIRRNGIYEPSLPENIHNLAKVATSFVPLDEGVTFEAQISYHNLRKIELGALISTLTFHNTPSCFHSLGMAKPLGFGKVALKVKDLSLQQLESLKDFEAFMNCELNTSWRQTEQIRELFAMASEQGITPDKLEYMPLKDFPEAKNPNERKEIDYLERYSHIVGSNFQEVEPGSSIDSDFAEKFQKMLKVEKEKLLRRKGYEELLQSRKEELEQEVNEKVSVLKERLISEIKAQQESIRIKKREERNNQLLSAGPDFDAHQKKTKYKDKVNVFYKNVESFLKKGGQTQEEPFLDSKYHTRFRSTFLEISKSANSKNRKKLVQPIEKNKELQKFIPWIGEDQVRELIKELEDSLI